MEKAYNDKSEVGGERTEKNYKKTQRQNSNIFIMWNVTYDCTIYNCSIKWCGYENIGI